MSASYRCLGTDETAAEIGRLAYLLGSVREPSAYTLTRITGASGPRYWYVSAPPTPVPHVFTTPAAEPALTDLLMRAAERSFAEVWDSPEDDVWDSL